MSAGDRAGRWGLRVAALLLATCALTVGAIRPAHAEGDVAFTITDERIGESSGLAADRCGNRYWTSNDSGDKGTAYALNAKGKVQGTLTFPASPTDVEAVAVQDCKLYLADIGDNEAKRDLISVYWFDNPKPGQQRTGFRSYDFTYPDGPHDAEAFMVSDSGRFYVVTKEATGGIYRAPSELSVQGSNKLERVGDAPAFVTDGVMVGDKMVLRTYVSMVVLDNAYAEVASANLPLQRQGESISRSLKGDQLLVGTEGSPAPVLTVDMPTAKGEVPPGSSAPPPSGSAEKPASSAPAATSAPETESGDAGGERTLTWVALGIAGGLAVLAAGLAALTGLRRTGGQHTVEAAAAGASPDDDDDDRDDAGSYDDAQRDEVDRDDADRDQDDHDDPYGDGADQATDERGAVDVGSAQAAVAAGRVAEPVAEAPRQARRSSGAHAVPRSAPVVPDDDEDADLTRKRAGSRFDAFFRPRRARHDVPETAAEEAVPRRGERPEPDDFVSDDFASDDFASNDAGAEGDSPEPERRAAARSDLDPAPRAWLDAAFDASRGEHRPRRARDD